MKGEVKAERQYYISDILYSPDSVMVYAPKSILDTISAVYTQFVNLEQVSDTTRCKVEFQPVKGARFTPSVTDVTFLVDVLAEKTVDVAVYGINFPEGKLLRTFPPKVKVSFKVGLSRFKDVTADDFEVVVDYNELNESGSDKCKPMLAKYPHYVHHVQLNPKDIDYIIEHHIDFND